MMDTDRIEPDAASWRLRPLLLAVIGAIAALTIQQLLDRDRYTYNAVPPEAWRIALSVAICTGAVAFGFGVERLRLGWSVAFALLAGAVAGLVYYWNGAGGSGWSWFGDWRYASLFLAIAIAVPLFQTARDEGGRRFPYAEVHGHAWTNVVLWFACWAFVGIVFALVWLLASLFDLIGLHFLQKLLEKDWFDSILLGAGFGAALGLLRERDRVVRLLQRVVTSVLAVLAPVLGVGLLLFLLALPFTGLHALWEATKSATPILLGCVVGALILSNAVIGNGAEDEIGSPVLRWGAMALGLAALPLCVIAAIATGLRIGQYGFTPERLWALIFVILATAYGVAYLVALLRGRQGWAVFVRPANLRMAFIVAGVALLLATPILSFNAISTADQVARLESGRITPDKFDWAALAFDFGDPGKAALKRLAGSKNPVIAARAKQAASKNSRYEVRQADEATQQADALVKRLRVLPVAVPVPLALRQKLTDWSACGTDDKRGCILLYRPGAAEAIAIRDECLARGMDQASRLVAAADCSVARLRRDGDTWQSGELSDRVEVTAEQRAALKAGMAAGKVEIRTVPRRQVFIGGVAVGDAFE